MPAYLHPTLTGFITLSGCRGAGYSGAMRINFIDISAYINLYGIEDKEFFVAAVQAMDSAYLKEQKNG